MANFAAVAGQSRYTIKALLVPLLTHPRIAKIVKYTVYAALLINTGFYAWDDYHAYLAALPPDAPWSDIFEQFATTIDMCAWLGLVFLFELETYALPDEAFKGWVPKALLGFRLFCYISIGYAAYGYTAETLDFYDIHQVDVTDTCQLAGHGIHMQVNVIDYVEITSDNCAALSDDSEIYQVSGEVSVVDKTRVKQNRFMGWIDVDNAIVWLIVSFLIEIEVWMQAADRFSSRRLGAVRYAKTGFYLVLIGNGLIWTYTGYALYAWDAFLWIFGFWAIELNLAAWEQDRLQELAQA